MITSVALADIDRIRTHFRGRVTGVVDALRDRHPECQAALPAEAAAVNQIERRRLNHAQLTMWLASAMAMLADVLPDSRPAALGGTDPWAEYNYPVPPPCSEHGAPCTGDCYDGREAHDAA